MRRLPTLALAALLVSCSGPTDPSSGPLTGRWVGETSALRPAGSYQYSLVFGASGRFTAEGRSYGVYAGQGAGDLSAYSRTVGAYQASGERLTFSPDTLIEWDRFYGAAAPPSVRTPYPYTGFYDGTRYTVADGVLTLRYQAYGPADEPVDAAQQLHRAE